MMKLAEIVTKKALSVGIDESNHGMFPEVFCGVLSKRKKDVQESDRIIPKEKKGFARTLDEISQRDYLFLTIESVEDYRRIGQEKMPGVVAASLLAGVDINFEVLNLIFDGTLRGIGTEYSRGLVSEVLGIGPSQIHIYSGGDFDRTYPLVNLADGMARYVQRQISGKLPRIESMFTNHQRQLIL